MTTAAIITAILTGLPAITAAIVAIIKASQASGHADRSEAAAPPLAPPSDASKT